MRTVDVEISLEVVEGINASGLQSVHIISCANGHSFADFMCKILVK